MFLVDSTDKGPRAQAMLLDLATQASRLARRFGFELHTGIARTSGASSLADRYREALAAAEKALSQHARTVHGEPLRERAFQLRELRAKLGEVANSNPQHIVGDFDRYVEAALQGSGYHAATMRSLLEAGFERVLEPLARVAAIDARSLTEIWSTVERVAETATSAHDLAFEYRKLVREVEQALTRPTRSSHERGTLRALQHVREHLNEPLSLTAVARIAGFAPQYFSRLLKKDQGVTFEGYVRRQRLTRACQLLADTALAHERIAKLCGFGSRSYFHRVFRQDLGETPESYRARERVSKKRRRPPFGTSKSAVEIRRPAYAD
jgi:AraC-like DNA-binding protein